MQQLRIVLKFIKYFFRASTHYHMHSPFMFDFAQKILEDDREYYAFQTVEQLRLMLKRNHSKIPIKDFGAGSKSGNQKTKAISNIAKNAASRPWQCQTLFRMVNHFKPKTMLELGTSLGISTLYQAQASLNSKFISLEGDPAIAKLARLHLKEHKIKNVKIQVGEFSQTLLPALKDLEKLDYVFIDGNHQLKPTVEYFETCLKFSHNETVFVFDDIHWSNEMEAAWEKIKAHSAVTISVDLFHMGIIFIRKEKKEKQHFILAPQSWKPWSSASSFFK